MSLVMPRSEFAAGLLIAAPASGQCRSAQLPALARQQRSRTQHIHSGTEKL